MTAVRGVRTGVRQNLACVAGAVGVLAMLHLALTRSFLVQSESMEPTLLSGDVVVLERSWTEIASHSGNDHVGPKRPGRGEVWVFRSGYVPAEMYVKRIIGIAGDTMTVENGVLSVNGVNYQIVGDICGDCQSGFHAAHDGKLTVVPLGFYYVMGDNPGRSMDSRHFGLVSQDRFVGRVLRIGFSYEADGSKSLRRRVRWSRLGLRVR